MRKILLPLRRIASIALAGALLGVPLAGQPKTLAPGEIVWAENGSRELDSLRTRYANAVQRTGNKDSDDARDLMRAIETVQSHLPWVLSFNFPGGPLSKFLALISKAPVVSFNVINTGDQADLETVLPPFTLNNAPIGTIRDVLHNLLLARGFTLNPTSGGNDQQMVCVLARLAPEASKPAPPTFFDSFPLAPYLVNQTVDDIVGAIRAGWELDPAHDKDALRLKFHPATSILLVSGPPDAINVAARIVNQLKRSPEPLSPAEAKLLSKE